MKAIVIATQSFLAINIISNRFNFVEIDGDKKEDIEYEDETEEEEKEEDASENQCRE